jgi:ATP-dependent exoDNAse (exonuclease V) beta subunit
MKEQGLAYKYENLQSILHGGIDELLETADGKLVLLDYKTRALPPNENTVEWSRLQLNTYTFLLQKLGYETENYALLIYYWPEKIKQNEDFECFTKEA